MLGYISNRVFFLFCCMFLWINCDSKDAEIIPRIRGDNVTKEDTTYGNEITVKSWPLRIPVDPLISAHYRNLAGQKSANFTELELQEDIHVEDTTDRNARQAGSGILFRNSVYNPARTPFNPYDPLSQSYDPLDPRYNPLDPRYNPGATGFDAAVPRDSTGLDAFSARRASTFSQGRGSKIIFSDTVTQLGTSWNPQTSEFTPTLAGIFFFTFNAITDRYTHFRISLQLNGADVVTAFGDLSGYQMAGNSVLLRMSEGDRVYLTLQEGRIFDVESSRAYTTFSGFRVL